MSHLRAQHLTVGGEPAAGWSAGGTEIAADGNTRTLLGAGSDGSSGLMVGWLESGSGRAVRLLSDGSTASGWDPTGTVFTPASPNYFGADYAGGAWFAEQSNYQICPDICYTSSSVSMSHLAGPGGVDGTWLIASSTYLYGANLEDASARPGNLIVLGAGGDGFTGNWTRISPITGPQWSTTLGIEDLLAHGSADDGAGGALLVTEGGLGTAPPHLLRRNASGANPAGWPSGGVPFRTPAVALYGIVTAGDGAGGVLIGWIESGGAGNELRVQRMTNAGVPAAGWPPAGVRIDAAPGAHDGLRIAADGTGGVYAAWVDRRSDASGDVYATHVRGDASLDPLFASDGSPISVATGTQDNIDLVTVPPGYAIVTWEDARDPAHHVVYAHRIPVGVTLDVAPQPGRLTFAGFSPNPARGVFRIVFQLPRPSDATLDVFDVLGRRVAGETWTGLSAGDHVQALDGPDALPNGVYLLRLRIGHELLVTRGLITR